MAVTLPKWPFTPLSSTVFLLPDPRINADGIQGTICKACVHNGWENKSCTEPHTALHNAQKPHAALCGFAQPVYCVSRTPLSGSKARHLRRQLKAVPLSILVKKWRPQRPWLARNWHGKVPAWLSYCGAKAGIMKNGAPLDTEKCILHRLQKSSIHPKLCRTVMVMATVKGLARDRSNFSRRQVHLCRYMFTVAAWVVVKVVPRHLRTFVMCIQLKTIHKITISRNYTSCHIR
jgi:hypothetical protein